MNTLKIILDKNASGKVAQLYKDFAMYVNSYQNKLVDVYVPKEMLYINAKELATNETPTNYANSVKIGGILTADDGSKKTTDSFYLDYLKETTINNVEYVIFERIMPKELTVYAGNQQIVVNVVSVDSGTTPPKVLQVVTTQICNLLIQNSDYIADETTVDPSKTEEIEAQLTTNTSDITNLKVRMTTAESNVEQNTEDIAKNTNDIDYLKQHLSQTEEYIGQMTGTTLPTNQQLNDFVMEKVSREPKNADVVIFVLQIPDATDKNYKYIYSVNGWNGYEIPPMEQASNGNSGIIEGTYNIGSTNNTIVDISGGQILNIYVKDTAGTFRNIREYINANSTNIANIISGNTSVGIALKAVADEFGNSIVHTYLKQTEGATKQFVYNYALPRVFNDIFYITKYSLSEVLPSDNYSFQKVTNKIGDNTLFDIKMNTKSSFELSKKNSANNTIYITADRDCVVTFRLKTQARKLINADDSSPYLDLDIELSTPISLQSLKLQKLEFTSIFTYLEDEVLKLRVGDEIRQILEVVTQEADETTFTIYSNTTYPSTFNLNTTSQVVYHTNGKLGEEPVFELAPSGAITASGVSFAGSSDAQLYNNVECQVIINIPIATQGYELFNENMSILGIELGGQTVRLATPYNFESGVATFKNLRQVVHSQDAVNGITYTMKCFIKISTGGDITFIVDEDNLNDYADKDYVELTAPKELFMGANGVEETNVYNFTVEDADTFIDFRTNKTRFLLDLHLPVVGALSLNKEVTITFGDTVYYLYNILKGNEHITIRDLKQVDKYNNATGYRFIFHATFFQNNEITGFAVIPTISMSDILSLTSDEMDSYMMDGGLTEGQIAICNSVGTVGDYTEGHIYKFEITYPSTYSWKELLQGGSTYTAGNGLKLTDKEFSIDTNVVAQQTDLNKALFSSTTNEEVWVFPNKLQGFSGYGTSPTFEVNFISNNTKFSKIVVDRKYNDTQHLFYDSTTVCTIQAIYQSFNWLGDGYKTITLESPATGELLAFLQSTGAVKQGKAGTPNKNTGDVGIIKQKTGDNFYPKTFVDCIYDDNGNSLNTLMPVANPTLDGTETNLTALSVNGTKYKIPAGGGSGGDYIAGNGINITDNTISADTNVLATKEDIPAGETDITFNGTATATTEDLSNVVIGDTTYLINSSYNPNLLLNDEMTINQREKSVYYGPSTYGTDRWLLIDDYAFMRTNTNSQWVIGIEDSDGAAEREIVAQKIENYKTLVGKTVTLTLSYSNLIESVAGTTQLALYDGVKMETVALTSSGTAILTATISSNADRVEVRIKTSATGTDTSLVFKYCKLELGSSSTLLVPKNIELALAECQRYYQKLSTFGCSNIPTTATSFDAPINLLTSLRTTPTLKLSAKPLIIGNGNSISSTSYSISSVKNNKAIINLQCTQSMTLNQVYVLSDVIAELDAEMY